MVRVEWMSERRIPALILAIAICCPSPSLAQAKPAAPAPATTKVSVPFVGCKSDGQMGPLDVPTGKAKLVSVPVQTAERLAYYKAKNGAGVLGPRGWHCFAVYGSNGGSLFVAPDPIDSSKLFSSDWKGFTSPVIQISESIGDTSGRFEVAKIIARVFPAHQQFVRNVIAEGVEPATSFPVGPYPKDKLKYRSQRLVEYETPALSEGMGTQSRILSNSSPIRGIEFLTGSTPDLLSLSIRLPREFEDLTQAIMQQAELEGAGLKE
jgi:hypothetical protein